MTSNNNTDTSPVLLGPDLNDSKPPLDAKLYRQIVLPNGLWCLLIQDTIAMHQHNGMDATMVYDEDDESEEEEEEEKEQKEEEQEQKEGGDNNSEDDNSEDDDDETTNNIRDAAAALLVGAGSAYDPEPCQGMAHFLEHLLFMGSQAWPGENEFGSFCSNHGGSDNAWTDLEHTVYHVSIPQEYLWPALERLTGHFVAPLLLENAVDRELRAIESEFQLHKPCDETRREQLVCATSKPGHYYRKFGWGNLRSLRDIPARRKREEEAKQGDNTNNTIDTPHQELRKFFDRYYYAANMRLVVMAAATLDQLQQHVEQIFGAIPALPRLAAPVVFEQGFAVRKGNEQEEEKEKDNGENQNNTVPVDTFFADREAAAASNGNSSGSSSSLLIHPSPLANMGSPLTKESSLQKIFRIVPLKDRHKLVLTWPLPSQMSTWRGKPYDYISHLLGHEGSGSLLSYLRRQNWATGLSAGVGEEEHCSSHCFFTLSITLSLEGLHAWKSVVDCAYRYIGMMRMYSTGKCWPRYIYDELKQMEHVSYLYSDEEPPEDAVCTLVENMAPQLKIPPSRILDGTHLLFEFDQEGIHDLLDEYLLPQNARIDLSSSTFGKYAEMDSSIDPDSTATWIESLQVNDESAFVNEQGGCSAFDASLWKPQIEPNFQTVFWCSAVPSAWLDEWTRHAQPGEKSQEIPIHLPPENPFVPSRYNLKELPSADSHHPLLNATIKVCLAVGKTKSWFPASVIQYDRKKNAIKVSYEDEADQWHNLDLDHANMKPELMTPDYEGTLDKKKNRFRILSLALPGAGIARKFGDESDFHAEEGKSFPPIPPELPANRLPKEVSSSNTLRMWYLQDRNFHRPIADLRLQVICAKANETPLHHACADLLIELLYDATLETSYLASVCQLAAHMETTCIGFGFRFHGFDDKLLVLFQEIFKGFVSFRDASSGKLPQMIRPGRFEACLEVLKRKYKNKGSTSSSLSNNIRLEAIRKKFWSANQKLTSLADITVEKFADVSTTILKSFAIECFYHGNITMEDAKEAKELITSMLDKSSTGLKRQKYPSQAIFKLPNVQEHNIITVPSKEPTETNTSVEVYIQVAKDNLKERVMIDLLVHMMEDPIFDQIRTKDQFGYDVGCSERWSYGIMGVMFSVVSNVKSAKEIVERIDKFLLDFRKDTLEKMTDDKFLEHLVAVSTQKLEMHNSMSEETDSYYDEIVNGRFQWQVLRDEAIFLRTITKAEALAAFDKWLLPGKKRIIMAVQVIGGGSSNVSSGRPDVDPSALGDFMDDQVKNFHNLCKSQTWGRINSKLA